MTQQAAGDVWAEPMSLSPDETTLKVVFSTTPAHARDPVTISRWGWHARFIAMGKIQPRLPVEHAIQQWFRAYAPVGTVMQLARHAESGIDLFGADVALPPSYLQAGYDPGEHNAGMLRLGFQGYAAYVLGTVGGDMVAMERLGWLYSNGGQPVIVARVQANFDLYEPGTRGNPGLVVVSFDPQASLDQLEQVAEAAYVLKRTEDDEIPQALRGTTDAVLANEETWCYHRRCRIAPEMTQGRAMHLADLWFHRPFLADGFLSNRQPRLIACLAQPGDQGGIELMPHDRIPQFFPPAQASALALRPA